MMKFSLLETVFLVLCLQGGVTYRRIVIVNAFESLQAVLPVSQRQALIEKSKGLNPSPTNRLDIGWSNRVGNVLTPIKLLDEDGSRGCGGNVYSADRPFIWNRIDVGGRMAVIEMPTCNENGKRHLWVHSPVHLDDSLRQALSQLGVVKYVVSPNYEHLKYALEWHQAFPEAEMWGCPGLEERKPEIHWSGEFPDQLRPVSWKKNNKDASASQQLPWDANVLQALHIDTEQNPFTGKPFFNEVVFYHQPTKSLIVTDWFWNYPASDIPNSQHHDQRNDSWELAPPFPVPWGTSLWKFGMDRLYGPFFDQFMVTDRTAYREICQHVVNEWDIETIIPCHGDILRGPDLCRTVLRKFFHMEEQS